MFKPFCCKAQKSSRSDQNGETKEKEIIKEKITVER
jgi:hypothetical protein